MLQAPDKPHWTEPPRGGGRVGLLGNVWFRWLFWEAQAGKRWCLGGRAVGVGAGSGVTTGVATGVTTGAARPNGADARCGGAPQDEGGGADLAGERQRDGR